MAVDLDAIERLAEIILSLSHSRECGQSTYKGAEEDVDNANEELGAEHSLPEIHWVTHLSKESDEQKGTTP